LFLNHDLAAVAVSCPSDDSIVFGRGGGQDVQRRYDTIADLLLLPQNARADFPTSLDDLAIGMISGRSEYFQPIKKSILAHTSHGFLLRAPGKCMCSFRWGFRLLRKKVPHAKWYYVGDDDAFINLPNLVKTLSTYDPAKKIIISGQGHLTLKCNMKAVAVPGVHKILFGGTGQILSAALVHSAEYKANAKKKCGTFQIPPHDGADAENGCALADIWTSNYSHGNLGFRTETLKSELSKAPAFVVAHHLDPSEISTLAHLNAHLAKSFRRNMELHLPNQCIQTPILAAIDSRGYPRSSLLQKASR